MWQHLLAPENVLFSVALCLMLMIAVLEIASAIFGVGLSSALESLLPDADISPHAELTNPDAQGLLTRLLGWLRIGKVPVLMLLVLFLMSFALTGLLIQATLNKWLGSYAPAWVLGPITLVISLPLVRFTGGILEHIMPNDETSAVAADSLIGRIAVITLGSAYRGFPAEAKVKDQHGYTHYVQLEPEHPTERFEQGNEVLLLSRQNAVYRGVINTNPNLTN